MIGIMAMAAAVVAGNGSSLLGVPLGTTLAQFKAMRPTATCGEPRSFSEWISCAQKVNKGGLPFEAGDPGITYYFDKSDGRLYEIELMMDDRTYKTFQAYLTTTYGKPDLFEDDGEDAERWTWSRGAYAIRYVSSCEEGAMCLSVEHVARRNAVLNRGVPK